MRVKYLVGMVGPGVTIKPNDEGTVPNEEGKRLCEAGFCVPVKSQKRKATIKPTETR